MTSYTLFHQMTDSDLTVDETSDEGNFRCLEFLFNVLPQAPKLTMRGVIIFLNLYTDVPRAKRDTVTADIYYYKTTEFGYAKCDLRLAAYDGVVVQWV